MNNETFTELAALNAAGALPPEEQDNLQRVAAADRARTAEVESFKDVAALVAVASTPRRRPAPSVKARIFAQIDALEKPGAGSTHPLFYSIGANEGEWQDLPVAGVRVKNLAANKQGGGSVKLYQLQAGAHFPGHHHSGPEECFVLSGDFHVEGAVLHAGDFHHAEGGSDHRESFTEGGCTLLVMVASRDYE